MVIERNIVVVEMKLDARFMESIFLLINLFNHKKGTLFYSIGFKEISNNWKYL